jgi:hypothetical protein
MSGKELEQGGNARRNTHWVNVPIAETVLMLKGYSDTCTKLIAGAKNETENNTKIQLSLTVPDKVKAIGSHAFAKSSVGKVELNDGLMRLQEGAFFFNKISEINLRNVKYVGSFACANNELTEINIPATMSIIRPYSFSNNYLTKLIIPENIKIIEDFAFYNNHLEDVFISDSVFSIGKFAFNNNRIKTLKLPCELRIIEESVFYNNRLEHLELPEKLLAIADKAFKDNNIKIIALPPSLTSVGDSVFANNPVEKITIGQDVEICENSFDDNDFYDCYLQHDFASGEYVKVRNEGGKARWEYQGMVSGERPRGL